MNDLTHEFKNKSTILVVDDTPENIDLLSSVLKDEYKVKAALNGEKALKIVKGANKPDLILLDIMMPDMDGYEVCEKIKNDPTTANIPLIFVTAKSHEDEERKGLEVGAVDYITKPISPALVLARVHTHLSLADQNKALESMVKLRTQQLHETRLQIIQRLGQAAEYKDNETGMHVIRMSHYSKLIAEAYCPDDEWVDLVFQASTMHDLGKIGIPDAILLKPGKLDKDEWEIMKKHAEYGAKILDNESSPLMKMSRDIALTHHEKWDGSGYPQNLKGEDIPIEGRIVALADVFDALTTERPYKKAWTVQDAIKLIDENSGSHFDPQLVPIFHRVLPQILEIKEQYSEELD